MRLLLSICLLLASVVAARAQSLNWPTPGMPMFGETVRDSAASARGPDVSGGRQGQALIQTLAGDDGKASAPWMTGVRAPRVDIACSVRRSADSGPRGDALACDDRRAIRAFRRVLLPPDIA